MDMDGTLGTDDGMHMNHGGMATDGMMGDGGGMTMGGDHTSHGGAVMTDMSAGSGMDGMDGSHAGHNMGSMGHMMMMMYFHFSKDVPHLLFESWNIGNLGELVGAVVFTVVLGVLYEGLKTLREYLLCSGLQKSQAESRSKAASEKKGDIELQDMGRTSQSRRECKKWHTLRHYTVSMTMHIIQSILHILQIGTAYIMMLIAMTYNAWLFFGVILGSGLGYFLFGKIRHLSSPFREQNDHCC